MIFDLPDITSLVAATGVLVTAIGTIIAALVRARQKTRAGVAATSRQRDMDLIRQRNSDKREIAHLERQVDTEHRNMNRVMDRWVEAKRKTVERFGIQVAGEIFGDTPRVDDTLSYDEIKQIRSRNDDAHPA